MNKLEEKFLNEINFYDEIRTNDHRESIASACAEITKEEMKKFAKFMRNWMWLESEDCYWNTETDEHKGVEELIELYLSQDEK